MQTKIDPKLKLNNVQVEQVESIVRGALRAAVVGADEPDDFDASSCSDDVEQGRADTHNRPSGERLASSRQMQSGSSRAMTRDNACKKQLTFKVRNQ